MVEMVGVVHLLLSFYIYKFSPFFSFSFFIANQLILFLQMLLQEKDLWMKVSNVSDRFY